MKKIRIPAPVWTVGLFIALLAAPFAARSQYQQHIMVMTLMAAVLASSWNIIGGYTGYTSLGHAAFFGLGGYLVAWTNNRYGWHPFISSWFLALVVMVIALIMGWISLRTQGSAFVVVTIAVVFIFRLLALNLSDITNGAKGLTQPRPGWAGIPWSPEVIKIPFYYIMLALLSLTIFVSWRIRQSKFGMGLIAIREDEGKAESVGIDTMMYKVLAFGISAYFVAVAGGIYSYFFTFIDPSFVFGIFTSVTMVLMAILGGRGTLWGPILGAFIMAPLSDWIVGKFGGSQIHLAVFGGILLLVMLFMPQGILPTLIEFLNKRAKARNVSAGNPS
ncbi:MAG: branched-chain amino acid ABC transporter permease [Chloroflexi bacterium]|nr:branched-chain amino acid ABC transporter permease [Chloroflexota bacterium]MBI3339681.1 branched-chain amino acid ABC transporter permease [Chloroflexota bacterium]